MKLFPPRHAISRARFFLSRANRSSVEERDDFEAYLEAAIVFTRAAIHRLQSEYQDHPDWRSWWKALSSEPAVKFIRDERNWILKEGPPKIGQIIRLGEPTKDAADLYYYEAPDIRATTTIQKRLDSIEKLVIEAQSRFAS